MKKITKLLSMAALSVALFVTSNVKAQTSMSPFRLGFGLEGGLVSGDARSYSKYELGGTGRLQYDVSDDFALTLTSGYENFFGKYEPGTDLRYQSLGMVPIKAGIKAFFLPHVYFGAEAGDGIETKTFLPQGVDEKFAQKNDKLILSPGLGFADKTWDLGFRYDNYSGQSNTYGVFSLRLAYGLPL